MYIYHNQKKKISIFRDATRTVLDSMYCFEAIFTKCTVLGPKNPVLGFLGAIFFQVFKKHSECPETHNKHLKYFYFLVGGHAFTCSLL